MNTVPPLKLGDKATEIITFENTGTDAWPLETVLVFSNGDDFIVNKEIPTGRQIQPGQQHTFQVHVRGNQVDKEIEQNAYLKLKASGKIISTAEISVCMRPVEKPKEE